MGLVEVINHNQEMVKCFRSWSVIQLVPVLWRRWGNVMDAISFKTPYDDVEEVYNGTENSELDDEVRERIGRIKGFNEALDDPKHYVEKTGVGPKPGWDFIFSSLQRLFS